MKHLNTKIKKHWAKIYKNAHNKLIVKDQLIAAFPERYSNENRHKGGAHTALKTWSIKYNEKNYEYKAFKKIPWH